MFFFLFADDTSTHLSGDNLKNLETMYNEELSLVSDWLNANKLSLNVSKSNLIVFRPHRSKGSKLRSEVNILMNGEKVTQKTYTKYLGIYIDQHLTWKEHIASVKTKLDRGLGLLHKLKIFAPKRIVQSAHFAFITPHIQYGLLNWGAANNTSFNGLNKCLKKVKKLFDKFDLSNNEMMLEVRDFNKLAMGTFMWKLHRNQLPSCIIKLFKKSNSNIPTRSGIFMLENPISSVKRSFITFTGLKFWNQLPVNTKNCPSIKTFKKQLKLFILKK